MEPSLRGAYQQMIPKLEAEQAIHQAIVVRVASYTHDDFQKQLTYWRKLAEGSSVGIDIDPRGRPITDNLGDFVKFWQGDRTTHAKYGMV